MGFLGKLKSLLKKPSSPKETPVQELHIPQSPSPKAIKKSPLQKQENSPVSHCEEVVTEALQELEEVPLRDLSPSPESKVSPKQSASKAAFSPTADLLEIPAQKSVKFSAETPSDPLNESKPKVKLFCAPVRAASPELGEEDSLSFDVPLEQIYAGISEAFGQMISASLQSSKWDKRSQALKAITTVLKGLDLQGLAPPGSTQPLGRGLRLRDRSRCWRLSCQLMHHVMRDKVMPVRMAAMELFLDTFANTDGTVSQAEAHFGINTLLEHVIDRLGDSNVRLHESAQKCVLLAAERPGLIGLSAVLSKLLARLSAATKGGERTKIHFGMIDTVAFLLQHFPGRREGDVEGEGSSWAQSEVVPFILAGMEDDALGPRVRNSAVALAVSVYQTVGSEAMQPFLARLRPAKQALLKQKFEEAEEDLGGECRDDEDCGPEDDACEADGDERPDLGGLIICGTAVKKPTQQIKKQISTVSSPPEEEECLMDGILEDAGMVFNGSGIIKEEFVVGRSKSKDPRHFKLGPVDSLPGMCDGVAEDFWQIEQELASLGFDLEGLDEQQALLSSLCEDRRESGRRAVSVY